MTAPIVWDIDELLRDPLFRDWAHDPQTGERGPRQITEVFVHNDTLVNLLVDRGIIVTTEDHPFWNASDQEWQEAHEIDPGEHVVTSDGDQLTVEGIDWATRTGGVAYNLTVAYILR